MSLSKFLDPKNDAAFHRIFGTERNKDILIHFLNDMVALPGGGRVQEVVFLKTAQEPEIAALKTSIVDVLCKDQYGNRYIIEMQVAKERDFEKRAQYYVSKAYAGQLKPGQQYHELKKVIFIAITDFVLFPEKKAFKSNHVLLDEETHEYNLRDFLYTFLELPKMVKESHELTTMVEKWAYFFRYAPESCSGLDLLIQGCEIMERAVHELERYNWSPEEMASYDELEKAQRDHTATLEQKLLEGEAIGMEKGEAIGIEKGRLQERLTMARGMVAAGIDPNLIVQVTQLTPEELSQI
jgi:predicted transposase/invertase (TIGR01784 family)